PLSIRACGFPAHGLPMIFLTWLRSLRIANGAPQAVQAVPGEPVLVPCLRLTSTQIAAPLLDHQSTEAPDDVVVDLAELGGGVPSTKVVAPPTQDRSQVTNDDPDIRSCPVAAGAGLDLLTHPL